MHDEDEAPVPAFGSDGELGQPAAKKEEDFPPIGFFGARPVDVFKGKEVLGGCPINLPKEKPPLEGAKGNLLGMPGIVWTRPDLRFEKGMHIRIKCKTPNCGAKLEGAVDTLLSDVAYKFKVQCPKCRCEFSRGRQFHMQTDQVRGIVELFKQLLFNQLAFEVELFWPIQPVGAVPGAPGAGEGPQEEWDGPDWSRLKS